MAALAHWTDLTKAEEAAIHRAACEIVAAETNQTSVLLSDPTVAGTAQRRVMGVFVTLKRSGQLRGCVGSLAEYSIVGSGSSATVTGEPIALLPALRQSGHRTVHQDHRFSPVTPRELPDLSVDVSLLFNFEVVTGPAAQRDQQIVIGRHGIRIALQGRGAIFLPVVPVEQRWDVRTYLEQLCRKAGLPVTAWRDPEAVLVRFEGHLIDGPFDARILQQPRRAAAVRGPAVNRLSEFAGRNLMTLMQGGIPGTFPSDLPDGECCGLALSLSDGSASPAVFSVVQPAGHVPIQTTLLTLTQTAANQLQQSGLRTLDLSRLRTDILIMRRVLLRETFEHDDSGHPPDSANTVLISHQGQTAWCYSRNTEPANLLNQLRQQTSPADNTTTHVIWLEADSTAQSLSWVSQPRPARTGSSRTSSPQVTRGESQPDIRKPAVAGTFYPASAQELSSVVTECLKAGTQSEEPEASSWPAAMVPHAGFIYSGRIAGSVYRRLNIPSTVIILSPRHTPQGVNWALAPHSHWQIPGAMLHADSTWMRRLTDGIDGLVTDASAHAREHGIETQLPFLAHIAPQTRIVGLTIGTANLDQCIHFGRQLGMMMQSSEEKPLLLISSDMNHFANDTENRRLDELALQAMESLNPAVLYETVMRHRISMCGVLPAVIVMEALRSSGQLHRMLRTGYATSAEVSNDTRRVVGYAGMLLGS